jgi:hypothetical protein
MKIDFKSVKSASAMYVQNKNMKMNRQTVKIHAISVVALATANLFDIITDCLNSPIHYWNTFLTFSFVLCLQTSPMIHLLRFHESFVAHIDFDNCQKELDLFKKSYSKVILILYGRICKLFESDFQNLLVLLQVTR